MEKQYLRYNIYKKELINYYADIKNKDFDYTLPEELIAQEPTK